MCQVPSGWATALVRPAPTSEPASGSVSTIVAPQRFSTISWARRCCCGVPKWCSVVEKVMPIAYISTAGLAPSRNSSMPQRRELGAETPPTSSGRPICQKPDSR